MAPTAYKTAHACLLLPFSPGPGGGGGEGAGREKTEGTVTSCQWVLRLFRDWVSLPQLHLAVRKQEQTAPPHDLHAHFLRRSTKHSWAPDRTCCPVLVGHAMWKTTQQVVVCKFSGQGPTGLVAPPPPPLQTRHPMGPHWTFYAGQHEAAPYSQGYVSADSTRLLWREGKCTFKPFKSTSSKARSCDVHFSLWLVSRGLQVLWETAQQMVCVLIAACEHPAKIQWRCR